MKQVKINAMHTCINRYFRVNENWLFFYYKKIKKIIIRERDQSVMSLSSSSSCTLFLNNIINNLKTAVKLKILKYNLKNE